MIIFVTIQTDNGAAVLDEMKLELTDMKISKILLAKESTESADSLGIKKSSDHSNMLDPTSFVLIIKRNLSSSWYKEIPEMDISGRLKSIVVCWSCLCFARHNATLKIIPFFQLNLMESDYKMLMMILSKNMSEGSDERTAIVQPVTPDKALSSKYSHWCGQILMFIVPYVMKGKFIYCKGVWYDVVQCFD